MLDFLRKILIFEKILMLMKKNFAAALLSAVMVLGCIGAKAQTVTKSNEFSNFTCIEASSDFEIVIKTGSTCKAEWIVDQMIEDLVQIYQKGNTLIVAFDQKSMTKDQKKYYKGKNAPKKILKATIYTPDLETLKVKDNVHVDASGATFDSKEFTLSMEDETTVNTLTVRAKSVFVETSDKAVANVSAEAPKVAVKSNKSSRANVNLTGCETVEVKSDNSCIVDISGNANSVDIQNFGSSKVIVEKGSATSITITSKDSTFGSDPEVDATAYTVENAYVSMAGGKAYVNASKILKLDLKSGSLVSFMDDPSVEIVKVEKSTITHYNGKK